MSKKLIILLVIIAVIVVATVLILAEKPVENVGATVAPEITVNADVEETASAETAQTSTDEDSGIVPEAGSNSNVIPGWTVEGEVVPEVTPESDTQVEQDLTTGENETERIPLTLIGEKS